MKKTMYARILPLFGAVALAALQSEVEASPFASCITNKAGNIQFYLNEGGGKVTVVYEDGTTNANFNGITTATNVPAGVQSFPLGSHTGYSIYVQKFGNGTATQISSDSSYYCAWNSPRGVDANKNPQNGNLFGRVYIANSSAGSRFGKGLYALTPDLSQNALGLTNIASSTGVFTNSTSSPWQLTVAPDNSIYLSDYSTANGGLMQVGPNFDFTNLVLYPVGENQGIAAGVHGDTMAAYVKGSIATGDLVIYTADPGLGAPASATLGNGFEGPTHVGDYNNIFRYDIGSGPLPWASAPNFAVSLGLPGFFDSQVCGVTVETNGYMIGLFRRANLSDPDIQVFDQSGNLIWGSIINGKDVFAGTDSSGAYGGVGVSPDGRFLAAVTINNQIIVCSLTNGIPDASSLLTIGSATTGNSRGLAWDAADNLYMCSSGLGVLRQYSLGLSTTCITSNDVTGTNGTFQLVLPSVTATVAVTANGSQNYINNASPGTPIPGIFSINLTTNYLATPVTVSYALSGSAGYLTNYTINLGTDANGITYTPTNVTFPAGVLYPGSGNWTAQVKIIPTATPVSGPTLGVSMRVAGGASYLAGTPVTGSLVISNTGPQLLVLSTATNAATMSRAVTGDYAKFIITRYGDLNGPGNSPGNVNATSYTVTNFTYLGTAVFPLDYTAQAQNYTGNSPNDGTPGIQIPPGVTTITNLIGNPVPHSNMALVPTNVTVVLSLTNSATGTNATSSEGYAYLVSANSVTLTEYDNVIGPEVVLWADPLTNSLTSTNWTLTFDATNLAAHPILPVVIPNYTNDETAMVTGGTNDFQVEFGNPIANDSVPQSAEMAANGWDTALRMTVNKSGGNSQAGVNLYPQGVNFAGNYALRFSMFLSIYSRAIGNPSPGTYDREYALFGINHRGTNCNWRTAFSTPANPGYAAPTNADGVWFAIDAGTGAQTPADFDAFTSPALPNAGVASDYVSNNSQSQNGVFKSPPFASQNLPGPTAGGEPINQWVDVSVEITLHTNVSVYMNRSKVLPSFVLTNGGGNYINGKPMLGYLDPVPDQADGSAFVYYSNVRVVELSPYIYAAPLSLIVTQGANVSFTSSAWLGTPPLTNTWYFTTTPSVASAVLTTTSATTNITSTLVLNNVQFGTNILIGTSDAAGTETALASLEVIAGPTNRVVSAGSNTVQFAAVATGPSAPTYQWQLNGVNLTNNSHYAGVTGAVLTITNAQLADIGTYTVVAVNPAGSVTNSATLAVTAVSPGFTGMVISGTNALLNFTTANQFDNTGSFTLQSSTNVAGPYSTASGTVTGAAGAFQIKVPYTTNNTMFYRLIHN